MDWCFPDPLAWNSMPNELEPRSALHRVAVVKFEDDGGRVGVCFS